MQLTRARILDGGKRFVWRSGPIYGVADDGKTAVAHTGVETAPSGALGEHVEIILRAIGMRRGGNKIVLLEAYHFFETHVGPVLGGVHDRGGAQAVAAAGVGDKRSSRPTEIREDPTAD